MYSSSIMIQCSVSSTMGRRLLFHYQKRTCHPIILSSSSSSSSSSTTTTTTTTRTTTTCFSLTMFGPPMAAAVHAKTWSQQHCPFSTTTSTPQFQSNSKSKSKSKGGTQKRLDVAIVGAPNAGKSQLLNALTGSTIAAVSRKRHTTRSGILGAYTTTHKSSNPSRTQLVFLDTPGYLRIENAREEGMYRSLLQSASAEMARADHTLIVVDAARRVDEALKEVLCWLMLRAHHSNQGRLELNFDDDDEKEEEEKEEERRERFAIVLNKVDLVHPKTKLLDLATDLGSLGDACVRYNAEKLHNANDKVNPTPDDIHNINQEEESAILMDPNLVAQYPPIFYISALQNDGIDELRNYLLDLATPCSDWVVPTHDHDHDHNNNHSSETRQAVTNMSELDRIEEIIREKLYRCLHKEVPHHITQINRIFRKIPKRTIVKDDDNDGDNNDGKGCMVVRIDQDLVVHTKSHHRLVTGKGGQTLKRIQSTAKRDLIRLFSDSMDVGVDGDVDVVLNLHVKLDKSSNRRFRH